MNTNSLSQLMGISALKPDLGNFKTHREIDEKYLKKQEFTEHNTVVNLKL